MHAHLIQLFAAFAGSVGFALLFNVRGTCVPFASSSGLVSWGIYLFCSLNLGLGDFASNIIAAAGLTLFSEIMARIRKAPATVYLVIGMIPLLPGGSLYLTLHHAVQSNWNAFIGSGVYTLMIAISIALGSIAMMSLLKVVFTTIAFFAAHLRDDEKPSATDFPV